MTSFEKFKQRLQSLGQVICYDSYWKYVFEIYGFEWKEWWDRYGKGFYTLISHVSQGQWTGSLLDEKGQDLLMKWLYYGDEEYIKPLYEWFCKSMFLKREEFYEKLDREAEAKGEKRQAKRGYVYLIRAGVFYKIGIAENLDNRLKAFKTSVPQEIKLIIGRKVKDYRGVERKLHRLFEKKSVKGEWFKLDKEDIKKIKEILDE